MSDFETGPPDEARFDSLSVWNPDDPEDAATADPVARLAVEVLRRMIAEGGPLSPGTIREAEVTGTIVLAGRRYETRFVFQASRALVEPPKRVDVPTEDEDAYRPRGGD